MCGVEHVECTYRGRALAALIAPLLVVVTASCGGEEQGVSAAALIEQCDVVFSCSLHGQAFSMELQQGFGGCSLEDGSTLAPDGKVSGSDGKLSWNWKRGVLGICGQGGCITCSDERCGDDAPDCSDRSDDDYCAEDRDRCLRNCRSGPSYCRVDCFSSASACYKGSIARRQWCNNPPSCPPAAATAATAKR